MALALADEEDGAIMVFQWCNKPFCQITGFEANEITGRRGTILIGSDTDQSTHLLIIDRLMKWERFSIRTVTNRKNGEPYWVEMNWTPLSDPITGTRWWLCSLIQFEPQIIEKNQLFEEKLTDSNTDLLAIYADRLAHLENENKRLHSLAKEVARESNEDPLTGLSNRRKTIATTTKFSNHSLQGDFKIASVRQSS
ncbi:MAG: PAS domain-containing protein [Pseudomonadota bacterium]